MNHPSLLFRRKKFRRVREIIEQEERRHRDHNSQQPLKNEDPAPPGIPTHAVHLCDRIGQQARERTRHARGAKKQALAELQLFGRIPGRKVVRDSRVEAGFGNTEEHARNQQAVVVLDEAHERHHGPPRDHDAGQPDGWAEALEQQVGWDLEEAVREEEDGRAPTIFGAAEGEVFVHALDLKNG
jgi:hypothetical protein